MILNRIEVNIISSGSHGNAVLYENSILVDCGVPFLSVSQYAKQIKIILLTHEHCDHFNYSTIKSLQLENPAIRIGCCEWMAEKVNGLRNIDIYKIGMLYDYKVFQIDAIKLYHDVPNCGYRIFIGKGAFFGQSKILHATDTKHLEGIIAKGYELYALECNYDEDEVWKTIKAKEDAGLFSHERGAINSHLSTQQAVDFFLSNKSEHSKMIRLHE